MSVNQSSRYTHAKRALAQPMLVDTRHIRTCVFSVVFFGGKTHCQQNMPANDSPMTQAAASLGDSPAFSESTHLPFQEWLATQIVAKSSGQRLGSKASTASATIDLKEWRIRRTIHEVREKTILLRVDAAKLFKRDTDMPNEKTDRRTVSRIFKEVGCGSCSLFANVSAIENESI